MSTLSANSSRTYLLLVIEGLPDMLADGAATGTPAASISFSAALCPGILTATVSSPPVVARGTMSFLRNIMVSGPGQNASMSMSASLPMSSAMSYSMSTLDM